MELADFLGIRQSSIASAKKKGTVPSDWLIQLLRKKKINPQWVLEGKGSRYLHPADLEEQIWLEQIRDLRSWSLEKWSSEELVIEMVKRFFKHLKAG